MSPLHEDSEPAAAAVSTVSPTTAAFTFDANSRASLFQELWASTELLFQTKLTWLLILGPIALIGDATGLLGEPICFAFSGLALVPCAERLSFVTEQVAAHTNGTIGALLNATFGNAPELLISTAALRAGFYRVVQLAMLGSMLTNLLFVFGVSCLVGGLRWQVQELRITSGNVSVGMLLASTAGCLLPVALVLSGELRKESKDNNFNVPSPDVLAFCRVNAAIMMLLYLAYLTFQLGTHKEEFDDDAETVVETEQHLLLLAPHYMQRQNLQKQRPPAKRNLFCARLFTRDRDMRAEYEPAPRTSRNNSLEMPTLGHPDSVAEDDELSMSSHTEKKDEEWATTPSSVHTHGSAASSSSIRPRRGSFGGSSGAQPPPLNGTTNGVPPSPLSSQRRTDLKKARMSDAEINISSSDLIEDDEASNGAQMSFRTGIVWLFIITLCISAMSDILVDTIDGFAYRMHISEVFTSMVIVPFFSNVAEQVSAILFAYRNEMDLCVGVTVGSAIQIALFVLPGCVLIGAAVDRSMTLFFRGYETACLFFGVVTVAAVLQGGTTNWLVGMFLLGIYMMMAAGFWFHELENLSTDAEIAIHNSTGAARSLLAAIN